jgi:hypothetical protein
MNINTLVRLGIDLRLSYKVCNSDGDALCYFSAHPTLPGAWIDLTWRGRVPLTESEMIQHLAHAANFGEVVVCECICHACTAKGDAHAASQEFFELTGECTSGGIHADHWPIEKLRIEAELEQLRAKEVV